MDFRSRPLALALLAAPGLALAQAHATVKPDGQFRYAFGAGARYASGNSDATSVNLTGDGVRATADSKWQFGGKALWGRTDGITTAENAELGTQYDCDFTPEWFSLGKADYLRDRLANVSSRVSLFGGVGRHVIKTDTLTWDLSAGLGYTRDHYVEPADVAGGLRTSYGVPRPCWPRSRRTSGRRRPRSTRSSRCTPRCAAAALVTAAYSTRDCRSR
jgi:putative salt-induced outer membrane protein